MFHASWLKPAIEILLLLLSTLRLITLVNLRCRAFCILSLSPFIIKLLSSFYCIGRAALCLRVPGSLGVPGFIFYKMFFYSSYFSPVSWIMFVPEGGEVLGLVGVRSDLNYTFHIF